MGVCNNCGNQISDGQLTCPVCGAYTGAGAQANNQTPQQNMYNQQGMDSSFLQAEFMVRTLIGYIVIFLA